jgi:hypothetical protein
VVKFYGIQRCQQHLLEIKKIHEALGIWYPIHQAFLDLMKAPSSEKNMKLRSLAVKKADLHKCCDYTSQPSLSD